MTNPANILIVDDLEINRNVLNDTIITLGHNPSLAENGRAALERIRNECPDLVLLDIIMPEMDGYQVLEHLKQDKQLRHLPVIVISAIDEMESIVRCIKQGADDYLTKPFDPTLLEARIASSLEKKHLRDLELQHRREIEEYNRTLEQRVNEKTKELSEAYAKLGILDKAKSDFLGLISHEFHTPLTGMLSASEKVFAEDLDEATRNNVQKAFRSSLKRLIVIVKQALVLTKIQVSREIFPTTPNTVQFILTSAAKLASEFAGLRQVNIGQAPDCEVSFLGEKELHTQALAALLKTAVMYSGEGGTVQMSCECTEREVTVGIHANGRSVPRGTLPKFFSVFSILDPVGIGEDLGLGPAVAERIITLFDGSVSVENQGDTGMSLKAKMVRADKK
ncbi:MAG: hybrid sensor histidine kinase/response regulator [Gammaproteobacteria bacterium]|nr:hybrid sensor histidine kinase/response regulator [Gammaproteobacteria bacterium]